MCIKEQKEEVQGEEYINNSVIFDLVVYEVICLLSWF